MDAWSGRDAFRAWDYGSRVRAIDICPYQAGFARRAVATDRDPTTRNITLPSAFAGTLALVDFNRPPIGPPQIGKLLHAGGGLYHRRPTAIIHSVAYTYEARVVFPRRPGMLFAGCLVLPKGVSPQ
jgi:hypothetical protein